jgi:hypothetical protein
MPQVSLLSAGARFLSQEVLKMPLSFNKDMLSEPKSVRTRKLSLNSYIKTKNKIIVNLISLFIIFSLVSLL